MKIQKTSRSFVASVLPAAALWLSLLVLASSSGIVSAQVTQDWTGPDGGTWDVGNSANWNGAVWSNNNNAHFGTGGTMGVVIDNGFGNVTATSLTFGNNGQYTLSGGALNFNSVNNTMLSVDSGAVVTISNALVGSGADRHMNVNGTLNFMGGFNLVHKLELSGTGTYNFIAGAYQLGANELVAKDGVSVNQYASQLSVRNVNIGFGAGATWTMADAAASITTQDNFALWKATFDLDQGSVTVGNETQIGAGGGNVGVLSVNGGTFMANSQILIGADGGGTAEGTLNVTGGVVKTRSDKGIRIGNWGNGNKGHINVSGGALYVGSDGIALNMQATYTIKLSGGTLGASANWSSPLDMTLSNEDGGVKIKAADDLGVAHNITLSGVLSGTGGFTKSGSGTLFLAGDNTYTGDTFVEEGGISVLDGGSLLFAIGASGVNNRISGISGTLDLDGAFVFDLTNAAAFGSWSVVDVDNLGVLFNTHFLVDNFTEISDGVWEYDFNNSTYTFDESTGLLTAVPEPSTYALLGASVVLLMGRFVRRRSRV